MSEYESSFATYQDAVNYLAREVAIAGGFDAYDKNKSGAINAREFFTEFENQAAKIPKRYFPNDGLIYYKTKEAAHIVFAKQDDGKYGILYIDQYDNARDPEEMGRSVRRPYEGMVQGVKKQGEQALNGLVGGAEFIARFGQGLIEGDEHPGTQTKSSIAQIKKMDGADGSKKDGLISRDEAWAAARSRAREEHPELSEQERDDFISVYINGIFKRQDGTPATKLTPEQYQRKYDNFDPEHPNGAIIDPKLKEKIQGLAINNSPESSSSLRETGPLKPSELVPTQTTNKMRVG